MLNPSVTPSPAPTRLALPRQIAEPGVIAIGRRLESGRTEEIARALAQGGVQAFEVTLNEPVSAALDQLARLSAAVADRMLIGAGTVLSVDAAERAVGAGARFLVTPVVDATIVAWALEHGITVLPGAFTPTEILTAWRAGATAVKLFPASVASPAAVREIHGPLPEVPLIPTGGVALDTVGEFIRAGATAIGIGSWLFAEPRLDIISTRAAFAVRAVHEARAAVRARDDTALGD